MAANRGYDSTDAKSRLRLIEAAANLLDEEGYHAISARNVAERAGLKSQLVHYYFRSMDDLLVAVFREEDRKYRALHDRALAQKHPLRALWDLNTNSRSDTGKAMGFMALGTNREGLRTEMQRAGEGYRRQQIAAVEKVFAERAIDLSPITPSAVAMMLSACARTFVMENALNISLAHDDLRKMMEHLLDRIEPLDELDDGGALARATVA